MLPQLLKDLLVSVRGGVPAVRAELFVVRIGGDTDLVPRAAQAQRLPEGHFVVRVKVPLPRSKYQLRIKPEPLEAPIIHIYICADMHALYLVCRYTQGSMHAGLYARVYEYEWASVHE